MNWTIKLKLFTSMLVLGIFPFMLSGLVSYLITMKEFTTEVKERLERSPVHLAHQLEAFLYFRWNDTLQLSHSPILTEVTEEARSRYLDYLFGLYKPYSHVRISDARGRIVAATDRDGVDQDASQMKWFQEGRKIPFDRFHIPDEAVYMEDVHLSEFSERIPVVSFTSPIYDQEGNFLGVVHNEVKMSFTAAPRDAKP